MLMARIKKLIRQISRAGTSPDKLALCIALGAGLGLFPVLGATTILCAVAALAFRLNLPLIQLVNYAVYPVQIILLVPFYAAGSWLFGSRMPIDAGRDFIVALQKDLWGSLMQVWDLTLFAVLVWVLVCPVVVAVIYALSKPAIGKMVAALQQPKTAQQLSQHTT